MVSKPFSMVITMMSIFTLQGCGENVDKLTEAADTVATAIEDGSYSLTQRSDNLGRIISAGFYQELAAALQTGCDNLPTRATEELTQRQLEDCRQRVSQARLVFSGLLASSGGIPTDQNYAVSVKITLDNPVEFAVEFPDCINEASENLCIDITTVYGNNQKDVLRYLIADRFQPQGLNQTYVFRTDTPPEVLQELRAVARRFYGGAQIGGECSPESNFGTIESNAPCRERYIAPWVERTATAFADVITGPTLTVSPQSEYSIALTKNGIQAQAGLWVALIMPDSTFEKLKAAGMSRLDIWVHAEGSPTNSSIENRDIASLVKVVRNIDLEAQTVSVPGRTEETKFHWVAVNAFDVDSAGYAENRLLAETLSELIIAANEAASLRTQQDFNITPED